MSKIISINQNRDFKKIYTRGRSYVSPVLVTYILRNYDGVNRTGITTSKKVGKAVKRTRARRIIREAYYQICPNVKSGFNIVFVARGKTCEVKTQDVFKSMLCHLKKAGILN